MGPQESGSYAVRVFCPWSLKRTNYLLRRRIAKDYHRCSHVLAPLSPHNQMCFSVILPVAAKAAPMRGVGDTQVGERIRTDSSVRCKMSNHPYRDLKDRLGNMPRSAGAGGFG